jgi:Ca-activated chloride channel family protein
VDIFWTTFLSAVRPPRKILGLFAHGRSAVLARFLCIVIVTLATAGDLPAQADINQVHVLPYTLATLPGPTQHVLRSNVDLVLVNVTVLDRANRAVTGLGPTNFAVLDDKNAQVVRYLANVDEPISLVVVLDASASMAPKLEQARKAFTELVNTSNPQDDFGLIIVSDKPRVALHFGDSISEIQASVDALQPEGATALWDGMYLGVQELKKSHYQRKAMVVISDGGDNHSRYTESELKSLLEEADVEVYAVGMFNRFAPRLEEKKGPLQLDEVTSVTGGRVFSVHDPEELLRAVTQISHELRNQYVLGYYPNNRRRDGKWRKLKVQLAGSASQPSFRLYAKKGYYAPTE